VTEFGSRNEVDILMDAVSVVIENVKLNKADSFAAVDYQGFISTAALLIAHLSYAERQLPRVVQYNMAINYPALALSNRIYADGSRSEELIAENQTVHPAFMQRDIIALSE
jgi:prophage DNA circulation protein